MSTATDALDGGLGALQSAFAARTVTPLDVLDVAEDRIAQSNTRLNILVHHAGAGARAAATDSTRRWRDDAPASALDGAPVAIKANIAIADAPWTAAIAAYKDRIATHDAIVTAKLRDAGAVIVGALNMHEAALGATTDGPLYGKAYNPLRENHTPGGSSGGSAAAVAAGYVAAALGTDTLGSVRIPAAYCGVVGFKPTYGAVSHRGMASLSWTLDHVGVHARKAVDVETVFKTIAGYDPFDAFSVDQPLRSGRSGLNESVFGRVRFEDHVECAPDVLLRFDDACARLREAGAKVIDITLDGYDFARLRRAGLVVCEAEASVAMAEALDADPQGFSPALRDLLRYGASIPAARLARIYGQIAQTRVTARAAFAQCDFLVLPTAPQTAFAHGTPPPVNQADLTAFANLAGLPAISVPMGVGADGLPTGLQIVARPWDDLPLLSVAAAFEALQRG